MTTEETKNQAPHQDTGATAMAGQDASLPKKPDKPAQEPQATPAKPNSPAPPLQSALAGQAQPATEASELEEVEVKPVVEAEQPAIKADEPATKAVQAETIEEAPAQPEAEAPAVKLNKTVELAEKKPQEFQPEPTTGTGKPETAAEIPKPEPQTPVQKTSAQTPATKPTPAAPASADSRRPKPMASDEASAGKPTPTPEPAQPAPAPPPVSQPVQPVRPAIPFMIKFKNKLAEFRQIANRERSQKVQKNLAKIMQYAKEKQKITNDEVEKLTGVKDAQAANYLNTLVKQGKLIRFGKKKNIFYKPVKQ